MNEIPPESSQPEEPQPLPRFSTLFAAQDEIDIRFGYIMDELGLRHIERGFDGPQIFTKEHLARFGNFLLRVMPYYRMREW